MIVLCLIVSYLIGSISTSTLVGKFVAHIDIRDHGSGNAGATNTLRVLGVKWALLVLLIDVMKGIVALAIAHVLLPHNAAALYLSGLAAICGHNWPIFFGFRGGKGVATTIGVLLVITPIPTVCAGVIAIFLVAVTRYVSLGALAFTSLTPVFAVILSARTGVIVLGCAVALLSIYRHRQNIARLVRGQEHRVFNRKL